MKCKSCKNDIPDGSVFCMFCGERTSRKKKNKDEIKVPKPTQLPSGSWRIQLKAEGQSVTESTPDLCITKAKAIRAGFIELKKHPAKKTLNNAIEEYILSKNAVLSPATIDGYKKIQRNNFKKYQQFEISSIDWQKAVNEEAKSYSPKSVHNAWGLVSSVLLYNNLNKPNIKLPAKQSHELAWLNYEQIQIFVKQIYGQPCEMAALLALHSLRKSELLAVTPSKIDADGIHVDGSKVYVEGKLIEKETNKTDASKRVIPIMIPRLQELIDSSTVAPDEPLVTIYHHTAYKQINRICRENGLPEPGYHGLRRSFASLGYHLGWNERQTMKIGGWNDWQTMHKIYIKLSSKEVEEAAQSMRRFYQKSHEFTTDS